VDGAKGNAAQHSTLRTQCRACVSPALGHIRGGRAIAACSSHTRGGSRMRESRTSGFVAGAHSNMCPYRDPDLPHAQRSQPYGTSLGPLIAVLITFALKAME
jgi:hypothetical protein